MDQCIRLLLLGALHWCSAKLTEEGWIWMLTNHIPPADTADEAAMTIPIMLGQHC